MDTMIGCIATFITSVGGLVATMENGSPWWVSFIISILSPVIYCSMNIALKVIINKEKNKGNAFHHSSQFHISSTHFSAILKKESNFI